MALENMNTLATLLLRRRNELALSAREVGRRAGIDPNVVTRLERAETARPRMDQLNAIGEVLGIPAADLYAAVNALPGGQLPSLRPYMRAKYRDLPEAALTEVEAFINGLVAEHGGKGPRPHEDES